MPRFDFFEHTADIGIRGYGKNYLDALEGVARGMFTHICDITGMEDEIEHHLEITASLKEDQVIKFLNRLLLLFETEHFVPVKYELIQFSSHTIQGVLHGDIIDPSKHEVHAEVKAATYHNLEIKKEDRDWMIQVILDV